MSTFFQRERSGHRTVKYRGDPSLTVYPDRVVLLGPSESYLLTF